MRALLDTHTFLWAIRDSPRLGPEAGRMIRDARYEILISVATAWEIATKVHSGKLPEAEDVDRDFQDIVRESGYHVLTIALEDALRAGRMPGVHRDPFDRMLAAQALALDIPILSIDAKLDSFGVRRIW